MDNATIALIGLSMLAMLVMPVNKAPTATIMG